MPDTDYQPPISQLLTYGRPKNINGQQWFNYVEAYGFTEEHIPELIRLASEKDLNWKDESECYAPIHAYRALGQLRAEAAIQPLLSLLDCDVDDWLMEDLPKVFGMIGPACIPALTDYLIHSEHSCWSKVTAAGGLTKLAQSHPGHREECVQILTEALARHGQQPPELNGSLVAKLLDLEATEAVHVIEKAYKEGPMDEMVCGSWASVQIELGLATAADFTPEELKLRVPEWMEPLHKLLDRAIDLIPSDNTLEMSAKVKAASGGLKLQPFDKGALIPKKPKSSGPKSGFGSQQPKKKKRKKKR